MNLLSEIILLLIHVIIFSNKKINIKVCTSKSFSNSTNNIGHNDNDIFPEKTLNIK